MELTLRGPATLSQLPLLSRFPWNARPHWPPGVLSSGKATQNDSIMPPALFSHEWALLAGEQQRACLTRGVPRDGAVSIGRGILELPFPRWRCEGFERPFV